MTNAEIGIANLSKVVDTLIVIPNEKLMQFASKIPINEAFRHADDVLREGIQGISDLIVTPSTINLDFADVRTVMHNSGVAHMGIGRAKGDKRTIEAVKQAVFSPLLETSIEGASKIILNIMGSTDMTLDEIQEATDIVRSVVQPGANIIFGADIRDNMDNEFVVTIIATGFNNQITPPEQKMAPQQRIEDPIRPTAQPQPAHPQQSGLGTSRVPIDDDLPEFLKRLSRRG